VSETKSPNLIFPSLEILALTKSLSLAGEGSSDLGALGSLPIQREVSSELMEMVAASGVVEEQAVLGEMELAYMEGGRYREFRGIGREI
jgi:hypothetical protein